MRSSASIVDYRNEKMKTTPIRSEQFIIGAALWLLLFLALSATQFNPFQLLNIVGFLTLIYLPGFLTMQLMRLHDLPFLAHIGIAIALGLLELMLVALVGNMLLPLMGIARPLDAPSLLSEFAIAIGIAIAACWSQGCEIRLPVLSYAIFENKRDALYALAGAVFPVLAAIGAIRLNNGASGSVTLVMLVLIAAYAAILIARSKTLGENVLPIALYFIALSLLLMNSLRGWSITGHDIQMEYLVFQLTKTDGLWSIAAYKSAYDACMSITILPTIFSNLLPLADPYVYKLLFQLLFAVVPPLVYLIVRRYVKPAIAFLAAFYFVAFPTFYTDMSFLNRQEIAFIFLAAMVYVIFAHNLPVVQRRVLFLIFSIGMLLSHYSTTYTVIGLLIFLAVARPILHLLTPRLRRLSIFQDSAVDILILDPESSLAEAPASRALITWWIVAVMVAATFLWSSVLTDTASGSLGTVITATIEAMKSTTKKDAQSSDVGASLLSYQPTDYTALFQKYQATVVAPARIEAPPGMYISDMSYMHYPITLAPNDTVPLTPLGHVLTAQGINVSALNYIFRQISAKLLQLLILVGFIFVAFKRRFTSHAYDIEFILLAAGSLLILVAIVVLPVLSVQYGLLRAFQQSLMFLGVFVVIGSLVLPFKTSYKTRLCIASVFAILFFLSETGVITEIFGGYNPQLNLNNDGQYYDLYYTHPGETAGLAWLRGQVGGNQNEVQTETMDGSYTVNNPGSIIDLSTSNDIYPGMIRTDTYVFLGYATVHKAQASVLFNGTQLTYTYPIQFLDDNKDLVYSNEDVKIYR